MFLIYNHIKISPAHFFGTPFSLKLCYIWPDKGGYLSQGSATLSVTSEEFGNMFEDDCRQISAGVDVGGQICADPGARTPIGASGNSHYVTTLSITV
jgi:hypothetical protein